MDLQVRDDVELLRVMMEDLQKGEALYKPTNYWRHYENWFLPELKRKGLKDFRRRRGSILSAFGAVE